MDLWIFFSYSLQLFPSLNVDANAVDVLCSTIWAGYFHLSVMFASSPEWREASEIDFFVRLRIGCSWLASLVFSVLFALSPTYCSAGQHAYAYSYAFRVRRA